MSDLLKAMAAVDAAEPETLPPPAMPRNTNLPSDYSDFAAEHNEKLHAALNDILIARKDVVAELAARVTQIDADIAGLMATRRAIAQEIADHQQAIAAMRLTLTHK